MPGEASLPCSTGKASDGLMLVLCRMGSDSDPMRNCMSSCSLELGIGSSKYGTVLDSWPRKWPDIHDSPTAQEAKAGGRLPDACCFLRQNLGGQ